MTHTMYFRDGTTAQVTVPGKPASVFIPVIGGPDKVFCARTRWGVLSYVELPQLDDSNPNS